MLSALLLAVTIPPSFMQEAPPPPAGVVVSDERLASEVGAEILRKGGNAVDAAVATAFALAVVQPAAGNIGGGGFMLVRMADGRAVFIDYRETAPASASRDMYLDRKGNPTRDSLVGYRAAGVPGTVAGMGEAMKRFGKLKWAQVVDPAIKLARDGFVLEEPLANGLAANEKRFKPFAESHRIFNRGGDPYKAGEVFKQPQLADTLTRIRDKGPTEFYTGKTAQLIATDMRANRGGMTAADLKRYSVKVREPLEGTYRGYDLLTAPPPSSGGTALIEMLNVLEGYDIRALGFNTAATNHLLAETMKRAFADRSKFMGDPDFVKVPVDRLTSKIYAGGLRGTISTTRATPSSEIENGGSQSGERMETTHFSVADKYGNAVANTYTLNGGYGSFATVKGAGFLLNNEMDDFTAKPGSPNLFGLIQGEANAIAPNKRPLSSMTPTIVLKDGQVVFVLGSPGGPTIINTVLQLVLNLVDHRMGIQEAVDAPRLHHQWMPDTLMAERDALSPNVIRVLTDRGHKLTDGFQGSRRIGIANCIYVPRPGVLVGAPDRTRHSNATASSG
jgi:gamma-glutamyltranspeptidase / glutathione hydrolase